MSIEKEQELLQKIGVSLFQNAPDGWVEIECRMSAVGNVAQCFTSLTEKDRPTERTSTPPGVSGTLVDLREEMYQEGKGTWFGASFILSNTGSFKVHFDYDNEPHFMHRELHPQEFKVDQEYFPRDEEHIPDWLREKLREAEGQD